MNIPLFHGKGSHTESYSEHNIELSEEYIKKSAKRLHKALLAMPEIQSLATPEKTFSLMKCQELVSQSLGFESFHAARQYNKQHNLSLLKQAGIKLLKKTDNKEDILIGEIPEFERHLYLTPQKSREHSFFVGTRQTGAHAAFMHCFEHAVHNHIPVIYFDTEGNRDTWTHAFKMAREAGREEDILVINYMTGLKDILAPGTNRISHTMNPFAHGSSGALTEFMCTFLSVEENTVKGRAISLISALFMALVYLRDKEDLLLNADTIRHYLNFNHFLDLYRTRPDLPQNVQLALRAYLTSLPQFDDSKKFQPDTVLEQHGYLQMQFYKILGNLSDSYGYIFNTNLGEVDYQDVVENKRILVVLMPLMTKGTKELHSLYHIQIACLKVLMSQTLGKQIEGTYEEVAKRVKKPCFVFMNGGLSFMPPGSAALSAQLGSMGFSLFCLEETLPQGTEAESLLANLNNKFYFKGQYPHLAPDEQKITQKLKSGACLYDYKGIKLLVDSTKK